MEIHVLPGDALTETFAQTDLKGEIIVCRECLIDGDVKADATEDFWRVRAGFIDRTYGDSKDNYIQKVRREFEKLESLAGSGAEVNLWFEYELFCQANLWFTLYYLRDCEAKIYRVAPAVRSGNEIWKGFGGLTAEELEKCFAERVEFSPRDLDLGADLWRAFRDTDAVALEKLSENESPCLPYLKEVCRAAIEKHSRPVRVLKEIMANGKTEFAEIFPEFTARAGVYGFGDAQVKKILAEI